MSTVEPSEHDLPECGIVESIKILGSVRILLPGQNVPVVFLIDEEHDNDECTEQNLANAHELIEKANVKLIGVESHEGGLEWDQYVEKYKVSVSKTPFEKERFIMGDDLSPIGAYSKFSDCMRSSGANVEVRGVECRGISDQIQCDGKQPRYHPLNEMRSKHFVCTLLELRSRLKLGGNLILNVGGNHNSHIENWINSGIIEDKVCQKAAYVRVRAPAYRE